MCLRFRFRLRFRLRFRCRLRVAHVYGLFSFAFPFPFRSRLRLRLRVLFRVRVRLRVCVCFRFRLLPVFLRIMKPPAKRRMRIPKTSLNAYKTTLYIEHKHQCIKHTCTQSLNVYKHLETMYNTSI